MADVQLQIVASVSAENESTCLMVRAFKKCRELQRGSILVRAYDRLTLRCLSTVVAVMEPVLDSHASTVGLFADGVIGRCIASHTDCEMHTLNPDYSLRSSDVVVQRPN